ncbi:MAG: hypothetical protein V1908_01880 [Candidatus Peregrinibacteria bacterium]
MNLKKTLTLSAVATFILALMQAGVVLASSNARFSQTISDGVQSVDVVNTTGTPVGSPAVSFNSLAFSFDSQTATGTLGAVDQKIRVFNPTGDTTWNVSLAATSGATATWSNGGTDRYDYNDANADGTDSADTDSVGGRLTVNPSAATLAGVGTSCTTSNVTLGSSANFQEGSVASVTLLTGAAGSPRYCRWDLTGVSLSQVLPASQPAGTYSIDFTLTIA